MGKEGFLEYVTRVTQRAPDERRILMLGLDNAGKSTILYKLMMRYGIALCMGLQRLQNGIGFNVESFVFRETDRWTVWDINGQDKIRPLWQHYFEGTQGLIFVVDSNDSDKRLTAAAAELKRVLHSDKMKHVPLLVFANKQDLPNSHPVLDVMDRMDMKSIQTDHHWHIQGCCGDRMEDDDSHIGDSNDDIEKGLLWLSDAMRHNKNIGPKT